MIWGIPIADFLLLLFLRLASSLLSRKEVNVINYSSEAKMERLKFSDEGEGRCSPFWGLTELLLS